MARAGATVVMGCRSLSKAEAVRQEAISTGIPGERLVVMQLDLASLYNVRDFAAAFLKRFSRLEILMLNAGLLVEHKLSVDGIEETFAINHVGHFLLTELLLETIRKSAPARIVIVSSEAHQSVSSYEVFEKHNLLNPSLLSDMGHYARSKLANVFMAQELSERLNGEPIYVNSLHPGLVTTNILDGMIAQNSSSLRFGLFLKPWMPTLGYDCDQGAVTQLFLATSPKVEVQNLRGKYFVPQGVELPAAPLSRNATLQKALWKLTEELIAERAPAKAPKIPLP
eukprot:NODE_2295_length_1239_cov_28.809244_g2091_i0.p1 GENE.NODE_2295_length_1239_cov_28.809244_g2091_i0~~NODE_2295_length_1239_cov_28.809244_g2091_i0.p1  ORF type:complete len:283 (+),score=60.04 NODE_2295_length_1239_cov_28.809244_g2091_i0:280-1128(+)